MTWGLASAVAGRAVSLMLPWRASLGKALRPRKSEDESMEGFVLTRDGEPRGEAEMEPNF